MKLPSYNRTASTTASRNPFSGKEMKKPFFNGSSSFFCAKSSASSFIQPKLTVGQPNDKYEKEADAMADQVVTQKVNNIHDRSLTTYTQMPSVLTKCSNCEGDEKLQKKPDPALSSTPSSVDAGLNSLKGSGSPLPDNTRTQMENTINADFSGVRVHTDSKAMQMSKDLNAQAFTHGTDIYFNSNKYKPQDTSGKKLLAHELTHVVQQNQGNPKIQREVDDRHDLTDTSLGTDPILEKCFDNELVIGKFSNSKGPHVKKIQEGLIKLGIPLPVSGADEKFGNETASAVKEFQEKAGMTGPKEWDGIVGRKTIGLLDMSLRNNIVKKDTDDSKEDFKVFDEKKKEEDEACKGKATDKPCPVPNTDVDKAAGEAIALIDKTVKEQLPPTKTKKADYPSIFDQIFRNNDNRNVDEKVTEVKEIYAKIRDFISNLIKDKSNVRCGTECDGGCRSDSPAYHTPKDGKHIITFCPDFSKHKDRILIVIHECHHAAIPGSSDKAYAHTRLFDKLDHTKALLNAASFHVYAAWVEKPGSQPIGPDTKDTNLIKDAKQKANSNLALAHIDQWFQLIPFDTSQTVQGVQEANVTGTYKQKNAKVFMTFVFSKWFGLTPPPARPTQLDVQKIKAIDERMTTMKAAFKQSFTILETPDASFWERGPGSGIALNQNVLDQDIHHLITALLQEMVHATPNISGESEPLYVGTINDMRNMRNLDPT